MSIRCCCSYRASERRSTRLGRGRWNRGTWQRGTRYLHKSLPENLIKKTKKIQQLVPQFAPTCAMVSVGSDADVQNVVHCLVSLPHSAILSAVIRSPYSRVSTAAAAARTITRPVRRPCQQWRRQRRQNQQRSQLHQPLTTDAVNCCRPTWVLVRTG